MKSSAIALLFALAAAGTAQAADEYNKVPAGDQQYQRCISYANRIYTGGNEASPIKGQSKVQAWCTCMWNETPDDFAGDLVKFSESPKGKAMNKTCEKYADWG
jgi:hypothetical protein